MRCTKLYLTCICFKKIKLTYCCFKSSSFICSSWIDRVNFFWPSKIHVSPTGIISSLSHPWCRLSSSRRRHTAAPCHASLLWSQDKLATPASSSGNAFSHRLPSRAEIKTLNSHHRHRSPSINHSTTILYCYKNVISTLTILHTTQPCLHFTLFIARAPRHWSFTRRHHSLSLSFHAHHLSAQWHPRWWTSQHFFTFQTTYWHMNSCKKIF
jgi:hypothetical protein